MREVHKFGDKWWKDDLVIEPVSKSICEQLLEYKKDLNKRINNNLEKFYKEKNI